ncbi:adenine deaminase [Ruminococcaceae bacterium OttesenSCG-928-I18]|nr:adenine deaminase [Ruminococcaceae bacterium OttesenSCG-928-I18]
MDRRRLVEVAAGREKAELVFKGAEVLDVFTGRILPGDVAVEGGFIAGVGSYSGRRERDCRGLVLCPGFIDAHVHIESSMVLPREFVRSVLPSGTTTLIADPHEIVNVCGAQGLRFMLESSEGLPCNLYYMLPSSVPTSPFETAGACFTADEMRPFLGHARVLGLGEVMCFPDVVGGRGEIFEKLALLEGRPIDGHAPALSGHALQAYAAAGVESEHEAVGFAEAAEKARAGMAILVREGSAAHNVVSLVRGLVESGMETDRFLFCTDDKHLDDIWRDGHIRWNLKLAMEEGLAPALALGMASYNTARHYRLPRLGAVAPGYRADLVLLSDLRGVLVEEVYKDGIPASEALKNLGESPPPDPAVLHTVSLPALSEHDLRLPVAEKTDVIGMIPYQLETEHLRESVPQRQGYFTPGGDYAKLCVVERHGRSGNLALAPLKGYGIRGGAIATTVAHDSHNILAAADNDKDLLLAIRRLGEMGGGYVLVRGGQVIGQVPLAVAGLMSTESAEAVRSQVARISKQAHEMGIPYHIDPFISLSFLALPVIPSLRLTDRGLFDVERFALL